MTEKELREIKRRFRPEKGNISKIVGCFVNENKQILSYISQSIGFEDSIVSEKMLGVLKKTLSGAIGTSLPRNDVQTTTSAGDIVLYSGNQIVIFYGSNSWAYTRLGHITDLSAAEMTDLLGNGAVTNTISMDSAF